MERAPPCCGVSLLVAGRRGTAPDPAAVRLVDTLRLPAGFSIAVHAEVPGARSMTFGAGRNGLRRQPERHGPRRCRPRSPTDCADEVAVPSPTRPASPVANGAVVFGRRASVFVADREPRPPIRRSRSDFVNQPPGRESHETRPCRHDRRPTHCPNETPTTAGGIGRCAWTVLLHLAVGAPCNVWRRGGVHTASLIRMEATDGSAPRDRSRAASATASSGDAG